MAADKEIRRTKRRKLKNSKYKESRGTDFIRPSHSPAKFTNEVLEWTYKAVAIFGANIGQLATFLGVDEKTIYNWRQRYPQFRKAIERGRIEADMQVAQSWYKLATGYTKKEKYVTVDQKGEEHQITYDKEVDPHPQAAMKWLERRRPQQFGDVKRVNHNVTGSVQHNHTHDLPLDDLSEEERNFVDSITRKQLNSENIEEAQYESTDD